MAFTTPTSKRPLKSHDSTVLQTISQAYSSCIYHIGISTLLLIIIRYVDLTLTLFCKIYVHYFQYTQDIFLLPFPKRLTGVARRTRDLKARATWNIQLPWMNGWVGGWMDGWMDE